jgi:hypothetical protein
LETVAKRDPTLFESAWDPRRLHTLEVRMEHEYEPPGAEEVPARAS